jgi:hypothetical protein
MQNSPSFALSRVTSRARRVAAMGLTEIGFRTRQASAKWIDRIQLDGSSAEPEAVLRRHATLLAGPATALDALRHDVPNRFFAGVAPESLADFARRFPQARRDVLAEADVLLTRRFNLLGYQDLWFGDPIDWHLDPVHSTRAPFTHWSQIDPLAPSLVGDSKIVWELNRHQWTLRLAQAAALGGDERHAKAAVAAIDEWIAANPRGYGINWASSLEVALRLMSWTWVVMLLRHSRTLTGEVLTRVLASVHAHASHVEKYLSQYYSPNTHLTGEALGLFYAGIAFREFAEAGRWREKGAAILIDQADRQIGGDGVYFEQSSCYQRYTCEIYFHFVALAARNDIRVPERTRQHLPRMLDFLLAIRRPDGTVPAIGDADGGYLMPLARRAPDDCRGVFALAAAMFGRPEFAHAAGGLAPEVIWLLGKAGADAFAEAERGTASAATSRLFPAGGYAVMRSEGGREAHQVIVDVGPLGNYGHGHADLLSLQCSVFGDTCLVDAGTYGYTAEPEWRDYFRSTAAHNTVTVNRKQQAEPSGPFGWRQRPRATIRNWRSTADFDLIDAEHDAFAAQGTAVVHRRRVIFVKPEFWIVIDDLRGHGTHSAEWSFQFAPLTVALGADQSARVETARGSVVWISPISSVALDAAVATGDFAPIRGWISPDYGLRVPSPMLIYSTTSPLPVRVITVWYPDRARALSPPAVHPILGRDGLAAGVRVEPARVSVRFDDLQVAIERG